MSSIRATHVPRVDATILEERTRPVMAYEPDADQSARRDRSNALKAPHDRGGEYRNWMRAIER